MLLHATFSETKRLFFTEENSEQTGYYWTGRNNPKSDLENVLKFCSCTGKYGSEKTYILAYVGSENWKFMNDLVFAQWRFLDI